MVDWPLALLPQAFTFSSGNRSGIIGIDADAYLIVPFRPQTFLRKIFDEKSGTLGHSSLTDERYHSGTQTRTQTSNIRMENSAASGCTTFIVD